ncbi:type VII secretion-associated serine protease mycosin [Actinacidiphila oryziradicis]|uniref:Type VII secretion-associated serine protease mycosin n=2 Tax=Actinacidiphila oryziradicis TaxID=2571141 RepID=A0A4U0S8R6_9ACTN|nr:type VII secretion-associated serine protease mycosin [Actinacidiphila oryziradicis]
MRTLHVAGGVVLAGVLVLASAPVASADQTRKDQWPLEAFDAAAIWKISKGKGVTVAVIDDGVNAQHIDLKGSVLTGKDFIDGGSTAPASGDSHGTQMASIIAGHGHGSGGQDGVMGLAPEAKILPIRDDGTGGGDAGAPIRYAVDHGASVINISMAGPHESPDQDEAIAYALGHDVLVVAGTGNDGTGPNRPLYPASYPGVLAVGGVKNSGLIWESSNYGPSVLVTAPATYIVSAGGKTNSSYRSGTGTSDATAFVSAAAALLRSKFPHLTAGQIVSRLTKTAGLPAGEKGLSLPDEHYGYGFIQPLAALTKDIPAGSKYGPLSVPASLKTPSVSATPDGTTSGQDSASSESSSKHTLIVAALGLGALVVLGLIIFMIVKISRRNKGDRNNGGGPGAPGGFGPTPGYPPYGQQPPQQHNPYAQPQSNPYQQPTQAPGQWPNQQ